MDSKSILFAACIQAAVSIYHEVSQLQGDITPERHARAIASLAETIYKELPNLADLPDR